MTPEEKKEKKRLADKRYYEKNKEKIKERDKRYYENNKEKKQAYKKQWDLDNKEKKNSYYSNNKKVLKEKRKVYIEKNREKIREYDRNYHKRKLSEDSTYKIKVHIRNLIAKAINSKGYVKNNKTQEILGCSFEEFKTYLESKFEPWMNWDNKGLYNGELNYGWDIDHIIPLASAVTEDDIIRLNHYTNLQPLCSHTNRNIKRDNLI